MLLRLFSRFREIRSATAESLYIENLRDKATGQADLNPSVYKLEDEGRVSQVILEHYASAGNDFPNYVMTADVSCLNPKHQYVDNRSRFVFLRRVHHELQFSDAREVQSFAAQIVAGIQSGSVTLHPRTKGELKEELRRLAANAHADWTAFIAGCPPKSGWVKYAKKP